MKDGLFRIGIGYDVHRIVAGRKLVIGGVVLPEAFGLEGHSDADVLSHALADAILGAAGLKDIGNFFPPGEPEFKDLDSRIILAHARKVSREQGWEILNLDSVLIAERPKIAPYHDRIVQSLAETLSLDPGRISIKATTNEGIGWIGRGEGMAAQAVCLLGAL